MQLQWLLSRRAVGHASRRARALPIARDADDAEALVGASETVTIAVQERRRVFARR